MRSERSPLLGLPNEERAPLLVLPDHSASTKTRWGGGKMVFTVVAACTVFALLLLGMAATSAWPAPALARVGEPKDDDLSFSDFDDGPHAAMVPADLQDDLIPVYHPIEPNNIVITIEVTDVPDTGADEEWDKLFIASVASKAGVFHSDVTIRELVYEVRFDLYLKFFSCDNDLAHDNLKVDIRNALEVPAARVGVVRLTWQPSKTGARRSLGRSAANPKGR